jgi:hypothetical protein
MVIEVGRIKRMAVLVRIMIEMLCMSTNNTINRFNEGP